MRTSFGSVAIAAIAAACFSSPVQALVLFQDNFEAESPTSVLNYNSLTNWTVEEGSIDLIRSGDFGITCFSGTRCLDIDGSSSNGGRIVSKQAFNIIAGETYGLSFVFSGNQRGGAEDDITIGFTTILGSVQYSAITPDRGFLPGGFSTSNTLFSGPARIFIETTSADNVGIVFDDVLLECLTCDNGVPEPAPVALICAALAGLGLARRAQLQKA